MPVWAIDAERVEVGGLGIRTSVAGERLGDAELGVPIAAERLVVADAARVHALLFGDIAPGHEVTSRTARVVLFSVGVAGVPAIHIEEALWMCVETLSTQ